MERERRPPLFLHPPSLPLWPCVPVQDSPRLLTWIRFDTLVHCSAGQNEEILVSSPSPRSRVNWQWRTRDALAWDVVIGSRTSQEPVKNQWKTSEKPVIKQCVGYCYASNAHFMALFDPIWNLFSDWRICSSAQFHLADRQRYKYIYVIFGGTKHNVAARQAILKGKECTFQTVPTETVNHPDGVQELVWLVLLIYTDADAIINLTRAECCW